jgi:uncharacterized damage-inducible protein DinB
MKFMPLLVCILISATTMAQQTTPKEAWLEKWENSKNYLIGIAEAMPEADYNFKPTERQMTFKEQLVHIKSNMDWLSNTYFTTTDFERKKEALPETKEETIVLITAAFDKAKNIITNASEESLSETVDFFAGPKSKIQILNLLQDHVSHHRGQLIVYLNLKDLEPPSYIGW